MTGKTRTQETILIVEDDLAIGKLLGYTLERHGWRVLYARNGQEAVDSAIPNQSEIDLILCDIVLKTESGPVVAAAIRGLCPKAKVLFISGLPVRALCERNLMRPEDIEEGLTSFLQKPFLPKDLMFAIERMLAAGDAASTVETPGRPFQNAMSVY